MNQSNNLSLARKELGQSQQEIANKLEITRETISNSERGKSINYSYLHYLIDEGYNKEWLLGNSDCEKYLREESEISQNEEELVTRLKAEAEEERKKTKKAESRILNLERKMMEMQNEITTLYKFLFKNRDKLDLTDLEASLGKHKASSFSKATLSEKELMYKLNFPSQR